MITECDEGLSFAGDSRPQQEPPPNPLKSQIGLNENQHDGLEGRNSPQQVRSSSPSSMECLDESCRVSPRPSRPQTLNLQSNQHLLRRRFKEADPRRPKSARAAPFPKIYLEEEEEVDENDNHLPPLDVQTRVNHTAGNTLNSSASIMQLRRLKQAVVRTNSTPNSPASKQRLSPPSDETPDELVTKSAPGSPQSPRRVFKPSTKPASGRISPVSPQLARALLLDRRRGSEPVAVLSRTNGMRLPRTRRDAVLTADLHGDSKAPASSPIMFRRGKSRYVHVK